MLDYFTPLRSSGHIPVSLVTPDTLKSWRETQPGLSAQLDHLNFSGKPYETVILRNANGAVEHVFTALMRP